MQGKAEPTGFLRHMMVLQTVRPAEGGAVRSGRPVPHGTGRLSGRPEGRKAHEEETVLRDCRGVDRDRSDLHPLLLSEVPAVPVRRTSDPVWGLLPEEIGGAYDADCHCPQSEVPFRDSSAHLRDQEGGLTRPAGPLRSSRDAGARGEPVLPGLSPFWGHLRNKGINRGEVDIECDKPT